MQQVGDLCTPGIVDRVRRTPAQMHLKDVQKVHPNAVQVLQKASLRS